MKLYLLLTFLFLVFICVGCLDETSADSIFVATPTPTPQIIKAEAEVIDGKLDAAKITQSVLNTDEYFRKVYFTDKENGWLLGNIESFYKTTDGGKNWTKLPIKVEKKASIDDFFFVNKSFGWMIIQRLGDINKNDTKTWLMKTNDGGNSWQKSRNADFG